MTTSLSQRKGSPLIELLCNMFSHSLAGSLMLHISFVIWATDVGICTCLNRNLFSSVFKQKASEINWKSVRHENIGLTIRSTARAIPYSNRI